MMSVSPLSVLLKLDGQVLYVAETWDFQFPINLNYIRHPISRKDQPSFVVRCSDFSDAMPPERLVVHHNGEEMTRVKIETDYVHCDCQSTSFLFYQMKQKGVIYTVRLHVLVKDLRSRSLCSIIGISHYRDRSKLVDQVLHDHQQQPRLIEVAGGSQVLKKRRT